MHLATRYLVHERLCTVGGLVVQYQEKTDKAEALERQWERFWLLTDLC